jgi:hypothetical protein
MSNLDSEAGECEYRWARVRRAMEAAGLAPPLVLAPGNIHYLIEADIFQMPLIFVEIIPQSQRQEGCISS